MFSNKSKSPTREEPGIPKAPLHVAEPHVPPRSLRLANPEPSTAKALNSLAEAPVPAEEVKIDVPTAASEERLLHVGAGIKLKGEISACDRLLVEGTVEAKLSDSEVLVIAESGEFKGSAEVDQAEISGTFDGNLVVRTRLVLHASGQIRGDVEYGQLEVERGGRIVGDVHMAGEYSENNKPKSVAAS